LKQQRRKPSLQRKKQPISINDPIVALLEIVVAIGTNLAEVF